MFSVASLQTECATPEQIEILLCIEVLLYDMAKPLVS